MYLPSMPANYSRIAWIDKREKLGKLESDGLMKISDVLIPDHPLFVAKDFSEVGKLCFYICM